VRVVAGSDWVIDIGPSAGEDSGHVVATGKPADRRESRKVCCELPWTFVNGVLDPRS
jgi:excinuclease UvrABC ATPase subunit